MNNVRGPLRLSVQHADLLTGEYMSYFRPFKKAFACMQELRSLEGSTYNSYRKNLNAFLYGKGLSIEKIAEHLVHMLISTAKRYIAKCSDWTDDGAKLLENEF